MSVTYTKVAFQATHTLVVTQTTEDTHTLPATATLTRVISPTIMATVTPTTTPTITATEATPSITIITIITIITQTNVKMSDSNFLSRDADNTSVVKADLYQENFSRSQITIVFWDKQVP